jgi:hypothetical protein
MRRDFPSPSYRLHVYPLGGRLPEGMPVELNLTRGELIKHEPTTFIWNTVLSDGRQVAVKMYKRWLLLWGHSLSAYFRAQREFDGLSQLEKLGIPCSVPLFWCRDHFGPWGWAEVLVTEWVARSQSLHRLLVTQSEARKVLDVSPLFADMARMHSGGLHHGALSTKNILVKGYPESPIFLFIDMPRCHRFPRDIRGTRMARFDLMCLCERLFPFFQEDKVLSWLSAYGIPESKKIDLLVQLKRFRSTKFLRRFFGAEFNVRSTLVNLFPFHPRNIPDSQQQEGAKTSIHHPH